jgi:hypothetical protein
MNRDQSRFLYNSVRFLDNCWFSGKAVIGITWRTLFGRLAWLTNCLGGALSSYGRNGRLAGLTNCLGGAFSSCGRNWPMHGPISDGCADPGADRLRGHSTGAVPPPFPPTRIHHRLGCGALSNARCVEARDLNDHLEGNHERAA